MTNTAHLTELATAPTHWPSARPTCWPRCARLPSKCWSDNQINIENSKSCWAKSA